MSSSDGDRLSRGCALAAGASDVATGRGAVLLEKTLWRESVMLVAGSVSEAAAAKSAVGLGVELRLTPAAGGVRGLGVMGGVDEGLLEPV
jgi:hypothetical protein